MCEACEPDWPSNAELRRDRDEALHELRVNATSDRSHMSAEGFDEAIRLVRGVPDAERLGMRLAHDAAARLLREFAFDEPCSFDHHGGCQVHGFLELAPGEKCPNQAAKDWLTAYEANA